MAISNVLIVAPGIEILTAQLANAAATADTDALGLIEEVCSRIEATAETFVPVRTGAAKKRISSETELTPYGAAGEVGPVYEGKESFYPYHLEHGTSVMAPHAFMGPALDRHSPEFEEGLAEIGDL